MSIHMIYYFLIVLLSLSCAPRAGKGDKLQWTQPDITGHWKIYDTEIVDEVPFLHLKAPEPDPSKIAFEDSPWDSYNEFDLVFEADSMVQVNYPIQAFTPIHYSLDSGYIHLVTKDDKYAYPAEMVNDTLLFYRPLRSEPGYFREKYLRTHFNDSILKVLRMYGINYPALAGTWQLVRERDYDYGTHFELRFPHAIPDSVTFTTEQMKAALGGPKIYRMITDGVKRDYTFFYQDTHIYFTPGKWYKGEETPIYFERREP
jgi:hypothetical protein